MTELELWPGAGQAGLCGPEEGLGVSLQTRQHHQNGLSQVETGTHSPFEIILAAVSMRLCAFQCVQNWNLLFGLHSHRARSIMQFKLSLVLQMRKLRLGDGRAQ